MNPTVLHTIPTVQTRKTPTQIELRLAIYPGPAGQANAIKTVDLVQTNAIQPTRMRFTLVGIKLAVYPEKSRSANTLVTVSEVFTSTEVFTRAQQFTLIQFTVAKNSRSEIVDTFTDEFVV